MAFRKKKSAVNVLWANFKETGSELIAAAVDAVMDTLSLHHWDTTQASQPPQKSSPSSQDRLEF